MTEDSQTPLKRRRRFFLERQQTLRLSPQIRAILMICGGVLLAVSWPPLSLVAAPFLAALMMLAAIEGITPHAAFLGGTMAGLAVGLVVSLQYQYLPGQLVLTCAVKCLFIGGWAALSSFQNPRVRPVLAMLWPGVVWCGMEYFRAELLPYRPGVPAAGMSQVNLLGQSLAPLVGVYGIGLVIFWWAGLLMTVSFRLRRSRGSFVAIIAVASALLLTLLPMRSVSNWPVRSLQHHEVVLVQPGYDAPQHPSVITNVLLNGRPKPLLIVWPLQSYAIDPVEEMAGEMAAKLLQAASNAEGALILGAPKLWRDRNREVMLPTVHVLNPQGRRVAVAPQLTGNIFLNEDHAQRLSPVTPLFVSGSAEPIRIAPLTGGSEGIQGVSRRAVGDQADLLVYNLAGEEDNSNAVRQLHLHQLMLRALECQRPVVAASWAGPTVAIDPFGGVIEMAPFGEAKAQRAEIPPAPALKSLFALFGWMVGPATLMATIVGAIVLNLPNRVRGKPVQDLPPEEEKVEE